MIRRIALAALPALLLLALAALTWADNAAFRGQTFTPAPQPVALGSGPQLGVNLYNLQFEPNQADVSRTLRLARDMGARYVRLQVPWDDVEIHARGDFEDRRNQPPRSAWLKYDFIMTSTLALGLEPIVRLDRAPEWARQQAIQTAEWREGLAFNGNSTGPPDDYADYARFVGIFAARYHAQVRFIQLWNEPNLAYEWNWQRPDPAAFTRLLAQASAAARAANPQVKILFPSLSPTDGLDASAPQTELEFLDDAYTAGAAQHFDIMSAQAYGLGQPPDEHRYVYLRGRGNWSWSRPIDTRIDVSRVVLLREVMERNHDAAKPVWISEFGYNSAPGGSIWGRPVTEQQKAQYLLGQLDRARQEWPWVGVMNVWLLRWGGYAPPNPQDPTPAFALVNRDYTPLPAYTALQAWSAQPTVAGPGAHPWSHPAVSRSPDGSAQVRFIGDTLAVSGLTGPVTIRVNAGPAIPLTPSATGEASANLSPSESVRIAVISPGPPQSGAFVIGRALPAPWLPWLQGLCVIALVAACAWLAVRLISRSPAEAYETTPQRNEETKATKV